MAKSLTNAYWIHVGELRERERILEYLEDPFWHDIQSPDIHEKCAMCKTISLIKGENE